MVVGNSEEEEEGSAVHEAARRGLEGCLKGVSHLGTLGVFLSLGLFSFKHLTISLLKFWTHDPDIYTEDGDQQMGNPHQDKRSTSHPNIEQVSSQLGHDHNTNGTAEAKDTSHAASVLGIDIGTVDQCHACDNHTDLTNANQTDKGVIGLVGRSLLGEGKGERAHGSNDTGNSENSGPLELLAGETEYGRKRQGEALTHACQGVNVSGGCIASSTGSAPALVNIMLNDPQAHIGRKQHGIRSGLGVGRKEGRMKEESWALNGVCRPTCQSNDSCGGN